MCLYRIKAFNGLLLSEFPYTALIPKSIVVLVKNIGYSERATALLLYVPKADDCHIVLFYGYLLWYFRTII